MMAHLENEKQKRCYRLVIWFFDLRVGLSRRPVGVDQATVF
jgi:hypothetical protein